MLGFSDALEVGYRRTEGLESFLVGYDAPISPFGTRLGFRFSNAESEVVDGPLEDADIQSRSRTFASSSASFRARRPPERVVFCAPNIVAPRPSSSARARPPSRKAARKARPRSRCCARAASGRGGTRVRPSPCARR
ncbi:MAG: hypothetical protein R3E53_04235 [Myxococcota bacterium]